MPPIKKDANAILYELITSLSTFKEHNERHGPDLARDESFTAVVIKTAKKLSELNEKDPEFHRAPNGEITITVFRERGPFAYKFDKRPIIAPTPQVNGLTWHMRSYNEDDEPRPPRIPLTDKEADILWNLV